MKFKSISFLTFGLVLILANEGSATFAISNDFLAQVGSMLRESAGATRQLAPSVTASAVAHSVTSGVIHTSVQGPNYNVKSEGVMVCHSESNDTFTFVGNTTGDFNQTVVGPTSYDCSFRFETLNPQSTYVTVVHMKQLVDANLGYVIKDNKMTNRGHQNSTLESKSETKVDDHTTTTIMTTNSTSVVRGAGEISKYVQKGELTFSGRSTTVTTPASGSPTTSETKDLLTTSYTAVSDTNADGHVHTVSTVSVVSNTTDITTGSSMTMIMALLQDQTIVFAGPGEDNSQKYLDDIEIVKNMVSDKRARKMQQLLPAPQL